MSVELVKNKKHIIIKRDGREEPYNEEKLRKVVLWACDNKKVFCDKILSNLSIKINDRMKITKLYDEVINTTVNMINPLYPIYDKIAVKLYLLKIYKESYGIKKLGTYPDLLTVIKNGLKYKVYSQSILEDFTEEEINELNNYIHAERDYLFTYSGLYIFYNKYCKKSKSGQIELPQHTYMIAAMYSFCKDRTPNRIEFIKKTYDYLSLQDVTFATPRISNSYTTYTQLASCVLNTVDDNIFSINDTNNHLADYSSKGGGLAYDVSHIRASGSYIGKQGGKSDGPVPFIKMVEETVSGFNQMNKRKGACVVTFPFWHLDVFDLLMLKDAGGTTDSRARKLQYAIRFHNILKERIQKNEDITLFCPNDVPKLLNTFGDEFTKNYLEYENKKGIRKKRVKAKDLLFAILKARQETGNLYITFIDNINQQNVRNDYVGASNLCVAGFTKLLTINGNLPVETLENKEVECWDGEQWSLTRIEKTNDNAEVMEVEFSDGEKITCTHYHEFDILQDYGKVITVEAKDLKVGDRLDKYNISSICIHGNKELELAYENGFLSADGTEFTRRNVHHKILYFYSNSNKTNIINYVKDYDYINYDGGNKGRSFVEYRNNDKMRPKFFVPDISYSIKSRIKWLEGVLDGDACLTLNKQYGSQSIHLTNTNKQFLLDIKSMLLELGIKSKIRNKEKEGYKLLPKNDGSGEKGKYYCKSTYMLTIPGSELYKLINLGFEGQRIKINSEKQYQRQATEYIKVISIKKLDEKIPVYCGNNPNNHKLIFNGIRTRQCQEISVPSSPSKLKEEIIDIETGQLTTVKEMGEIGICNLISINLTNFYNKNSKEKDEMLYILMRGCDNILDTQDYPVAEGKYSNIRNRPIGIGVLNYANLLALHKIKMTDDKTIDFTNKVFDDLYYRIYRQSVELSKERGSYSTFKNDKWADGLTPVHLSIFPEKDKFVDWEKWNKLGEMIKQYGVRFSLHSAIAPTQCQSAENEIKLADNSIISYKELIEKYTDIQNIDSFLLGSPEPQWLDFKEPIEVKTRFGNKKSNRIWYNGKQPVVEVTFEDGSKRRMTLNHPLLTKDGWKKISELNIGDEVENEIE